MTFRPGTHDQLWQIAPRLPTDYDDFGGRVSREDAWAGDCSCGCVWASWLKEHPADWLVCCRPDGPRRGLLTFEHMAGGGGSCFMDATEYRDRYGPRRKGKPAGGG